MRNPIIVALDVPSAEKAVELAAQLAGTVGAVKIGSELFTIAGPDIVRRFRAAGLDVFLDLKFHDIPNTVAKAVASAVQLDVQMLTIHTAGGTEMMQAAEKSAHDTAASLGRKAPPLVLGVTVLTSMDQKSIAEVGFGAGTEQQVERLARLAAGAGLRGLVCSPREVERLRTFLPARTQLVTPGIRMPGSQADDQKRTLTPKEALGAGADWLVVGRPIYAAPNPRAAAEQIFQSLV